MRTRFRRPAIAAAITLTTLVAASPAWAAFPDQGNRIRSDGSGGKKRRTDTQPRTSG